MTSVATIPGDGAAHPEAARQWLEALGCPASRWEEVLGMVPACAPLTLKQVFTSVMNLGREAGRLGETMALLGHQEAEFHRLRMEIGIPRAAPPEHLVPAAVLLKTPAGWMAPGGWVPDLIDRAAGLDVLNESGHAPRFVSLENVVQHGARRVFVVSAAPDRDLSNVMTATGLAKDQVHSIDRPVDWLRPGPGLARAVFVAASRMHDLSAVFSDSILP